MPKQKDLKRVVRTRMQKTGESYTAARIHVVAKHKASGTKGAATPAAATKPAAPVKQAPPDYASLAGYSDETIAAKTGCTWEKWVGHLDYFGAADKPHREIAEHVHEKFGVSGWWSQAVAVGYERIRGLRAIGQRRGGAFEATKSKTVAVPLDRLFAAFADAKTRKRWLPGVALVVRRATDGKSMRITWDDGTDVVLGFAAKGPDKSMVAVQHGKLPDKARSDELKRFWGERLDALAEQLAGAG